MADTPFLHCRRVLRELTLTTLRAGADHADIERRFDELLLLADKLLLSVAATPDLGDLPRRVQKALLETHNGQVEAAVGLAAECVEPWMKAIALRVDPAWYSSQFGNSHFTLAPVYTKLSLLSTAEANLPNADAFGIHDPVRRAIRLARLDRNSFVHGAPQSSPSLSGVLVAMLAALDRHRTTLRRSLRGVITRPLPPTVADNLLRIVRGEREKHLTGFVGRGDILEELERRAGVPSADTGYVIIHAPEGFGKSALASQLTARLSEKVAFGPDASDVVRRCPWLPGALFHAGKQSRSPPDIVDSIVAQGNALLVRSVEQSESQLTDTALRALRDTLIAPKQNDRLREPSSIVDPFGALRTTLYTLLERLVEERGDAILVIDSLDEIAPDGVGLAFLPSVLPEGATVVLTLRPAPALLDSLRRSLRPIELKLDGLSPSEIALVTDVPDMRWNERLYKSTKGAPLYVRTKADQVRERRGDYASVNPEERNYAIFRSQLLKWKTSGGPHLYKVLLFLSVLEPVVPVGLELVQSFVSREVGPITFSRLREELEGIAGQIEGLDEHRVKLGVKAFAEWVLEAELNKIDLRVLLERVADWMATDDDVPSSLRMGFVCWWTDERHVSDTKQRAAAQSLVQRLAEVNGADALLNVYYDWRSQEGARKVPAAIRAALQLGAEMGNSTAARILGSRLLDGRGIPEDQTAGEQWLRRSAEDLNSEAVAELGRRLVDGDGLSQNVDEGRALLEQAVELGSITAMRALGRALISGEQLPADPLRGVQYFEQAIRLGDARAKAELGQFHIFGGNLPVDIDRGLSLLRSASGEGDVGAALLLGLAPDSMSSHLPEEVRRGFLMQAAEADARAMGMVASLALDGHLSTVSSEEALSLLTRASDRGDELATVELAQRLIDGDKVPKDVIEGERRLRKAVQTRSYLAMTALGYELIRGGSLAPKPEEGERLLRRAGDEDYSDAMRVLGEALFEGKGLKANHKEAEALLRRAVKLGNRRAPSSLGYRLYEHSIGADIHLAREIWRECIGLFELGWNRGTEHAIINIAYMVRRGEAELPEQFGSVQELMDACLEEGSLMALLNCALHEVARTSEEDRWRKADRLLEHLTPSAERLKESLGWWSRQANIGDREGDLVVAWMLRHRLTVDPQLIGLPGRIARAREGGWNVPAWFETPGG